MGTAWTAGINLYATVAVLGLAGRFEMIQLPPELQILMHPLVIGVACVMYLIVRWVVPRVGGFSTDSLRRPELCELLNIFEGHVCR